MNRKVEWNEAKAKVNHAKQRVSFDLAKEVFSDPFAVEFLDDRQDYGEQRFTIIGAVEGRFLSVTYTERKDPIRIISARTATRNEREAYLQENA